VGSYTGNPYSPNNILCQPAWSGFIKCDKLTSLKAIVSKASHYGYLPANFPSPPDIIRSMYYTNCFLFPKSLVITYVCADMGLLYPTCNLVICEKNFWTVCCTVTFINVLIFYLHYWLGLAHALCYVYKPSLFMIALCNRADHYLFHILLHVCMSVDFASVKVVIK